MSFAEVARPLRGVIPCSLVGEAAWEELLEFVADLPVCVANHDVGFEVRLGSSCPVVDFGFAVCAGSSLAEALAAPSALVPEGHARACGRYLRAEAPLLASLLFEYDLAHGRRLPALFAVPPGGGLFESPGVPLGVLGLARPGLSVCQRHRLAGLFGSGSSGAFGLSSVGLFSGRQVVCLRLSTIAPSLEELGVAAPSLGWFGDTQWVVRALGHLPGRFQYQVGVDVLPDGAVGERLGVELHAVRPGASWIDGGWGVSHPRVWRPVLDTLVALGLCVPEKAAALVDFHGRWRVDTAYGACLVGGGLSHLKLVFSGETVFAKAYPAFGLLGGWLGVGATSRARRGARG